jgi:RNA polymerase sigma factor (sigma-70 family)
MDYDYAMNELTRTTTMLLDGLHDSGNRAAWEMFHERCRPTVIAYARRRGLQEADAEDLAQECLADFVRAYQGGQYDRTRGRLRQWLSGFVARRVSKAFAKRAHEPGVGGDTSFMQNVSEEDPLDKLWEEEWERSVLDICKQHIRREFDDQQCSIFEAYAIQGRKAEEVALEFGVSTNSVYIYKTRILSRLRELQLELSEIW